MKHYVVGILSIFENQLKLFKVTAVNEYEAVKSAMIEFTPEKHRELEIEWQNSPDYPKDMAGLVRAYEELPFSIVEVGSFLEENN